MSKRSIEVTVLSARGLKRSNPLWKLQTLCVAWIDPEHKYCSKIDKFNDTHPIWNLNFSSIVDADADFSDSTLTVEVHSREPIFHFSKLECTATVLLKEFVAMADKTGGHSAETASFQLRSPSGKPRGIVDVCVRVGHKFQSHAGSPAEVRERHSSYSGKSEEEEEEEDEEKEEPVTAYPATLPIPKAPSGRPEDFPPPNYPYSYPPKLGTPPETERPNPNPNPSFQPPPPRPPPYWEAPPAPYGPQPYGGGPYGYSHYPPPEPALGGNNYFGLPNGRPNYGAGPQRPGLGLAAGAMAGGLAGGMLFGLDGLENGINDALNQPFHGGHVSVYGDSLF